MKPKAQLAKEDRPTAVIIAGQALTVRTLTGDPYGHDCQLSTKHNVRVCADPGHQRDVALLRDALHMLGLVTVPPPARSRDIAGRTIPPRARCQHCNRMTAVGVTGRLHRHPVSERDASECAGSHTVPAGIPAAAVAS